MILRPFRSPRSSELFDLRRKKKKNLLDYTLLALGLIHRLIMVDDFISFVITAYVFLSAVPDGILVVGLVVSW